MIDKLPEQIVIAESLPIGLAAEKNSEIQLGLIKQLYSRARSALVGMPVAALLLAISLKNYIDNTTLLSWMLAILGLTLVRSILIFRFDIVDETKKQEPKWLYRYVAVELFSGISWGVTALILKDIPPYHEMIVYLSLAGMLMGAAMILATSVRVFCAFAIPAGGVFAALTPIMINDEIHYVVSLLVVLFTFIVIYVTVILKKEIVKIISLAYENNKLLEHVQKANSVLRKQIQNNDVATKELSKSKNELTRIFDNMQDVFFRIGNDGRIAHVSPSVVAFLGYDAANITGIAFAELLQTPSRYDDLKERLQRNGSVRNHELIFLSSEGKVVCGSVNAKYYIDDQGVTLGIEGTVRDITENKITANALIRARDEYKELFEFNNQILHHAPIGIIILGKDSRIKYMNPAMERIQGVPVGEQSPAIGQVITDLASVRNSGILEKTSAMFFEGKPITYESKFVSMFGKENFLEIKGVPLFENGEYNGGVVLVSDITSRIEQEEKLRNARDKEHAASVAKSQFIANMNHELRTPLNGIIGMTEIMEREITDSKQREHLDVIQKASQNLLDLVKQVLDLAQIESGALKKQIRTIEIRPFIETVVAPFENEAKEKNLLFKVNVDYNVRNDVNTEPDWLRQILTHLLSNALKFTHEGSIIVNVRESKNNIRFEICDTGIGIEKNQLASIFEHFYQADTSLTRAYGGTGIGTTIAKEFVEALQGKIWVESEKGKGTTIFFTLPLDATLTTKDSELATIIPESPRKLVSKPSLEILVAEDNIVNQMVIRKMLESLGHNVTIVANGKLACEMVQASEFDLIIMDIQMPVLNGIDATKVIRNLPDHQRATTPIIALTAHLLNENRETCKKAGMDACIEKPITIKNLRQTLQELSN